MTGGNNTSGEFSSSSHLMSLSFSGSLGYIVLVHAEYLDAAGAGQTIGAVQTVNLTPVAVVPEPVSGLGLACGALTLGVLASRRRKAPPAR